MEQLAKKLRAERNLPDEELRLLIEAPDAEEALAREADAVRRERYGTDVFVRGLIEFTNYCRNNCYYCGIRAGNVHLTRYRLSREDILDCCRAGYDLGYRTFVLQGGEDPWYTDEILVDIVRSVKEEHPDCAVTLSAGERSAESYRKLREAGTDRYLLRHETASDEHYHLLHPDSMSLTARKACLWQLKELGYQVGSGFMVGSPFQTTENVVADLRFLQELQPDMIGIGPYMRHEDTPFRAFPNGSLHATLRLVSILRLMFPYALLPATTALGTIHPAGREMGLAAGANVVMPNLSPAAVRKFYSLYDNKICTGEEAAECRECLSQRVRSAGYELVTDAGNVRRDSTDSSEETKEQSHACSDCAG